MPSKYDTNPLDPEFPEKARAAAARGESETRTLPYSGSETQRFPEAVTEEQTRRFAPTDANAYSAPYVPPGPIGYYQQAPVAANPDITRKVEKIGLPENLMTAFPYIPWYIGAVSGLLVLLLVPKTETKVRFHAAQGLAAHIGIFIVTAILGIIGNITDLANIGSAIFNLITSIMLVVFAIKAWKGKPVHIESVDSMTNWLEDKLGPVN